VRTAPRALNGTIQAASAAFPGIDEHSVGAHKWGITERIST
jgi:hypothetical protein